MITTKCKQIHADENCVLSIELWLVWMCSNHVWKCLSVSAAAAAAACLPAWPIRKREIRQTSRVVDQRNQIINRNYFFVVHTKLLYVRHIFLFLSFAAIVSVQRLGVCVCVCVWLINCCTQNTQNQINVNQSERNEWKNNRKKLKCELHTSSALIPRSRHGPDVDICITAFAYIVSEQL